MFTAIWTTRPVLPASFCIHLHYHLSSWKGSGFYDFVRKRSLANRFTSSTVAWTNSSLHSAFELGLPDHLDEHRPSLLWGDHFMGEVDASTFHSFIGLQSKREAQAVD